MARRRFPRGESPSTPLDADDRPHEPRRAHPDTAPAPPPGRSSMASPPTSASCPTWPPSPPPARRCWRHSTACAASSPIRRSRPVHREIAGLAVGVAVDNAYGVAFHSTVLASLGVDEHDIDAMRAGGEPADPVSAAVCRFARSVAVGRGKVDDDVLDERLRGRAQRRGPPPARRRVRVRWSRRHHRQPRRSRPARRVPPAPPVEGG